MIEEDNCWVVVASVKHGLIVGTAFSCRVNKMATDVVNEALFYPYKGTAFDFGQITAKTVLYYKYIDGSFVYASSNSMCKLFNSILSKSLEYTSNSKFGKLYVKYDA